MRKKLVITVVACMMLSLAGCGNKDNTSEVATEDIAVVTTEESTTEITEESTEDNKEAVQDVTINSALDILNTVWGGYAEADQFPVGGGDSANLNFEGPGAFDATNAEELDVTLGFPAAQVEKIDHAASMMNAMMANNFTAGVYHVKDSADVQTVADALKENIMSKQWMCGMPEKMVVISVNDYVISAFGLSDSIDTFKTKLTETYGTATVLYEESIS